MILNIAAVVREAAARWRQDRALLIPIAGLLLFVPQWAMLLFIPDAPPMAANTADVAAMTAWAEAAQRWAASYGPLYLGAFLLAQWGQLALVALYVGVGERPTVGGALARAGRFLPRFVLAELLVSMPLAALALAGSAVPPVMVLLLPAILYVLGRTLMVGPAILARGQGTVGAVAMSWRWSRGNGAALALVAGALMIGAPLLVQVLKGASGVARLANPAALAAFDALAAAIAAAAMLALAMTVGVLYRRLAR